MTALMVLHGAFLVGLIAAVLLQSGKSAGLGTVGGGADQFFRGKRRRSQEVLLYRLTLVFAVGFMVSALTLAALQG